MTVNYSSSPTSQDHNLRNRIIGASVVGGALGVGGDVWVQKSYLKDKQKADEFVKYATKYEKEAKDGFWSRYQKRSNKELLEVIKDGKVSYKRAFKESAKGLAIAGGLLLTYLTLFKRVTPKDEG